MTDCDFRTELGILVLPQSERSANTKISNFGMDDIAIQDFISRWKASGGAERANYQLFLTELCEVLGVPHPDPTVEEEPDNKYVFEKNVFEKNVKFDNGDGTMSTRRIDLYKQGCFVCETKQGVEKKEQEQPLSEAQRKIRRRRRKGHGQRGTKGYDDSMLRAKGQAEQYARNLPSSEGRPPFLLVIDVGHSIELYSDFSQTGGIYTPFPDAISHRISIDSLTEEEVREKLQQVWVDRMQQHVEYGQSSQS